MPKTPALYNGKRFFRHRSQSREIRKVPRVPRFCRYSRATREYFMEIINYTARVECPDGSRPPRIASHFWRTIDVSRHFLATATAENAKFQSHSNNYSRSVFDARDTVNSRNKIVVNCRPMIDTVMRIVGIFISLFRYLPVTNAWHQWRRNSWPCAHVVFCFEYFEYICMYAHIRILFRGFPLLPASNIVRSPNVNRRAFGIASKPLLTPLSSY